MNLLYFLAAFISGIISAWGIGGGTLLLLIMTLFFGFDQRTAQGINLLYFLPTAFSALWVYRKQGLLCKSLIRHTAPWSALGALAGSLMALHIDSTFLKKPFGIFLLLSGLSMLRSTLTTKKRDPR